jgi:hypothetical protein
MSGLLLPMNGTLFMLPSVLNVLKWKGEWHSYVAKCLECCEVKGWMAHSYVAKCLECFEVKGWMAHSYVAKCLECFEVKGWMTINHEMVEKK